MLHRCLCSSQAEVVGMYFSSVQQQPGQPQQPPQQQDPQHLCLNCYRMYAVNVGCIKAEQCYSRVAPHAPGIGCSAWSESGSEFISTRDSFSSCNEDEDDDEVIGSPSGAGQPGNSSSSNPAVPRMPPNKGQLTAQQQRQLAWLSAAVNRGVASGPAAVQQQQQLQLAPPPLQAGQQQQQQQDAAQQMPVPAPGMFVFGSKGVSSSSSATAAVGAGSSSGAPAAAGLAGSCLPAGHNPAVAGAAAGAVRKATVAGADALSFELIAELEAVHAARKVFLQGQPAAAAAAAAPFLQQVAAFSQQQQQLNQQAPAAVDSTADMPALAPLGTARQHDVAAAGDASSSAAAGAAGADMGTPTASGRTWRDWLLPKKLLQWSEGEEGQDEAADGQQDDLFGQMGRHSSEPDQRESAAVAGNASVLRRHSDGTAGSMGGRSAAGTSSSRQQAQQRQGSVGAAGDVAGRGPSSAPCSPRTPAAKDGARQMQGPEGAAATIAAAGCAVLELDSAAEQDLSRLTKQMSAAGPAAAAAGASRLNLSAAVPGEQQLVAVKPGMVQQGQMVAGGISSSRPGMQQVDASIAAAGGDVLVDEIIRCMAQVYAADKDVADMTLGCLIDFVRRKLLGPGSSGDNSSGRANSGLVAAAPAGPGVPASSSQGDADSAYFSSGSSSKDSSPASRVPAAGAAAAGQQDAAANSGALAVPAAAAMLPPGELQLVQQFLASPEAAYLSPEMMHATLCCLPASDLQMALAYVVRQHEDTMTQPGQTDSEADTASQSVLPEDDAGCMPLFQLHHLDELSFEQLVEHIWPGELEEVPASAAAVSAAAATNRNSGSGKGGKGAQQLRSKLSKADRSASAASASAATAAAAAAAKQPLQEQPKLLPASWWLEHLQQSGKAADPPATAAADQRVLRWVYGNIVSSQAEEFAAGQTALRCNLDRQTALLELYEGMANAWRRMQRVADKKRVLEQLRQNIKVRTAMCFVWGAGTCLM
jgi:hypothetical protein